MNNDTTQTTENQVPQKKLATMKKIGKISRIVTLVTSIVASLLLILFLLMPATNLQLSAGKYIEGYNYYGWQLAIFGCGYPPVPILAMFEDAGSLAGDFVPTTHDFDTNFLLILAIILPIIAFVAGGIVSKRMKNRGKAVCEFVSAGCLLLGAILLINCAALSVLTATNSGTTLFKSTFLDPAIEAGTYTTNAYPIILFVVLLFIAVFKALRGAFLLYQRNYAKKVAAAK